VGVAVDAERREDGFGDRSLRNAAPGYTDLEDGTGQKEEQGFPTCLCAIARPTEILPVVADRCGAGHPAPRI